MASTKLDDEKIARLLNDLLGVNASEKALVIWGLLTDVEGIDVMTKAENFIAENPIDLQCLLQFSWMAHHAFKSDEALYKAMVRLDNDPKQKALKEIKECYQAVRSQFKRRGYSAQFSRDMHAKYPEITDLDTIKKLVAKLNKSNELIPVS